MSYNGTSGIEKDYVGNFIYSGGNLDFILTSEGRICADVSGNYNYEYFIKDHLGNIRVSFWDSSGVAAINQETSYYPFGMIMNQWDYASSNEFLYNGKEMQDELGLDWYDYGARFYDPVIARWNVQDPLAEKYIGLSPYNYTANNPILFIDPNGQEIWIYYNDEDGNEQKMQYEIGMQYEGTNKFLSSTISSLNAMGEVDAGNEVLSTLIDSDNLFDFTNTKSSGGERTFQLDYKSNEKYKDGGAQIHAAEFLNNSIDNSQKVESAAHELFHGYQREMGQKPGTVNGEVGAYLFGRGVAANSKYGSTGIMLSFGNMSSEGSVYENAMLSMMYGWDSNHMSSYQNAINSFHKGAAVNKGGLYNKHKIDPNYNPLIIKFLPLIK